jgi:hypothetical protein
VKITVYSADRAGDTWDVATFSQPLMALWVLEVLRVKKPCHCHGIYDKDDPERGDIQLQLEELLTEAEARQVLDFEDIAKGATSAT